MEILQSRRTTIKIKNTNRKCRFRGRLGRAEKTSNWGDGQEEHTQGPRENRVRRTEKSARARNVRKRPTGLTGAPEGGRQGVGHRPHRRRTSRPFPDNVRNLEPSRDQSGDVRGGGTGGAGDVSGDGGDRHGRTPVTHNGQLGKHRDRSRESPAPCSVRTYEWGARRTDPAGLLGAQSRRHPGREESEAQACGRTRGSREPPSLCPLRHSQISERTGTGESTRTQWSANQHWRKSDSISR